MLSTLYTINNYNKNDKSLIFTDRIIRKLIKIDYFLNKRFDDFIVLNKVKFTIIMIPNLKIEYIDLQIIL